MYIFLIPFWIINVIYLLRKVLNGVNSLVELIMKESIQRAECEE